MSTGGTPLLILAAIALAIVTAEADTFPPGDNLLADPSFESAAESSPWQAVSGSLDTMLCTSGDCGSCAPKACDGMLHMQATTVSDTWSIAQPVLLPEADHIVCEFYVRHCNTIMDATLTITLGEQSKTVSVNFYSSYPFAKKQVQFDVPGNSNGLPVLFSISNGKLTGDISIDQVRLSARSEPADDYPIGYPGLVILGTWDLDYDGTFRVTEFPHYYSGTWEVTEYEGGAARVLMHVTTHCISPTQDASDACELTDCEEVDFVWHGVHEYWEGVAELPIFDWEVSECRRAIERFHHLRLGGCLSEGDFALIREFYSLDTDQDAMLSASEASVAKMQKPFAALDADSDGYLSPAELQREAGTASPRHSADIDLDGVISLGELLRTIQLYNAGGYSCAPGVASEDGFLAVPHSESGLDPDCPAHASDYNPANGLIGLSELLRTIQLFNTGTYQRCAEGGEDGFCGVG